MNPLVIANTQIRQDRAGRYCLNDLHQASGGASRHQPGNWLRLQFTQELVAECARSEEPFLTSEEREPVVVLQGGFAQGTYAVKELVYSYAMWISAAFHLHVIRAYDAMVQAAVPAVGPVPTYASDHRADQMVSAERIFRSAMRIGRALRLNPREAVERAAAAALRNTGVDWASELGADAFEDVPCEARTAYEWEGTSTVAVYIADRNIVSVDEVHANAFGGAGEKGLRIRIGRALTSLGWQQSRRFRLGDGTWTAEYKRGARH